MIRSASAEEIAAVPQPNSALSGKMSAPGSPIAPAVVSSMTKVTAATTQP